MVRLTHNGAPLVYEAAERFVSAALTNDDSLFTPGIPIWTLAVIEDIYKRFVESPDGSADTFENKFRRQIGSAGRETIQLGAELLYVYFLIAKNIHGQTKRKLINEVLSWASDPIAIPSELDEALDSGIGSVGIAFHTYRPFQLHFLLDFVREWKTLDSEQRAQNLEGPAAFRRFLFSLPIHGAQMQREGLLHLIHPDSFEPIVAQKVKEKVAKGFAELVPDPKANVDDQLAEIRKKLSEEYGSGFSFYDPEVKKTWQADPSLWSRFVQWAERFHEWKDFDEQERTYKLEVAQSTEKARQALLKGEESWPEQLEAAFKVSNNNLTTWRDRDKFIEWMHSNRAEAEQALKALWDDSQAGPRERIHSFLSQLPKQVLSGPGGRLSIASFLLMCTDPEQFPIYRYTPFKKGFDLTGYEVPPREADEAQVYQHVLEFLDQLGEEAASRDLALRDRLDAQAVLWCITRYQSDEPPLTEWSEKDRQAFLKYRGDADGIEDDGVEGNPFAKLADSLLFPRGSLKRIDKLLRDKGQIIFYGPPGTGKTFLAKELANYYANGRKSAIEIVQFHPSYAYEDFVEGYRPYLHEGTPGFRLLPGPFKRIAAAAAQNPDVDHVLIIDEINRANVAKIFGELYFLLEYRNDEMSLQYSAEPFSLPPNLWIIGTMNTADRSIALIDAALRRRFYFIALFPDEPPIKGLLRRWLEKHKQEMSWVADVVDRANSLLDDRDSAIGPSHFLRKELNDEWVQLIWKHSIMPYLAEQFYGEEERLSDFDLDLLRQSAEGTGKAEEVTDESTDAPPHTD